MVIGVAAGGHDPKLALAQGQGVFDHIDEIALLGGEVDGALLVSRPQAEGLDGLDHAGEHVDDITVAEGEDRIQVHVGALARHETGNHALGRALFEEGLGEEPRALSAGSLADADQHRLVADRHDIAALDAGQAPIVIDIVAPPELEVGVLEHGVKLVDGRHVQGLLAARRPVHGMQRHSAIDPGRGIAREELIGQWPQDEVVGIHDIGNGRRLPEGQLLNVHAADQVVGQLLGVHLGHGRVQLGGQADTDHLWAHAPVEQPFARLRVLHRLLQQLAHEEDLDVAVAHHVDEGVMLDPSLLDPDDVVEQQLLAVRGGQPTEREARTVDDDLSQLTDFGMNSVGRHSAAP